ncbi:MAG TPA: hypothetical protein VF342_12310 [Alphaproteobacteria bacterium]
MSSAQSIRTLLRVDAALCFACGLPGVAASGWLAGFLLPGQPALFGVSMPTAMLELGLLLAAYAGLLLTMAGRARIVPGFVAITVLGDGLWVLGTLVLLLAAGGAFSLWGSLALLLVAADTALLGVLKWRALNRSARPAVA